MSEIARFCDTPERLSQLEEKTERIESPPAGKQALRGALLRIRRWVAVQSRLWRTRRGMKYGTRVKRNPDLPYIGPGLWMLAHQARQGIASDVLISRPMKAAWRCDAAFILWRGCL